MNQSMADHRTRVTRLMIRKAFTELLSQKPIQTISIKELCETAGINRGTFYKHYLDIYDLQSKIEDEMEKDFKKTLEPLLREENIELTPVQITTGIFQCLKDNADICIMTLGEYGDRSFALRLLQIGQERCVESYSRYFADASMKQIEYFYTFASSGCVGLLQKWLREGMSEPAEELAWMAEQLMMKGIEFLRGTAFANASAEKTAEIPLASVCQEKSGNKERMLKSEFRNPHGMIKK